MKIGILTVPFNNNYGGYLQAYALMAVLKRMGHQPYMIMRRHNLNDCSKSIKIKILLKSIIKAILYRDYHIIKHPFEAHYFIQGRKMQRFVRHHLIPQTDYYYSWNKLEEELKDTFDALVVGSDQVWRSKYVPDIENYYFSFAKHWSVRRIAYAASFGTTNPEYTEQEIEKCGCLISQFDAVSVRENGALEVFDRFGWNVKNPSIVLDPTLLLDKTAYDDVIGKQSQQGKRYLFSYVLDNNKEKESVIAEICKGGKLLHISIANIQDSHTALLSIEEWLGNIKNAELVITDSFHGMVFSIIFHVPFVVIANKSRGADRFESLLNRLELLERLAYKPSEVCGIVQKSINWKRVEMLLHEYQFESIDFLNNCLNPI